MALQEASFLAPPLHLGCPPSHPLALPSPDKRRLWLRGGLRSCVCSCALGRARSKQAVGGTDVGLQLIRPLQSLAVHLPAPSAPRIAPGTLWGRDGQLPGLGRERLVRPLPAPSGEGAGTGGASRASPAQLEQALRQETGERERESLENRSLAQQNVELRRRLEEEQAAYKRKLQAYQEGQQRQAQLVQKLQAKVSRGGGLGGRWGSLRRGWGGSAGQLAVCGCGQDLPAPVGEVGLTAGPGLGSVLPAD